MNYNHFDDVLQWGAPERILYFPLVLVLLLLVWFWGIKRLSRVRLLARPMHVSLMLAGFAPWRLYMRMALHSVALLCAFVALLQPQWGRKEVAVMQEGRDVLVALDISGSMQAQDLKPSRLAFVKLKIKKLLERLSFERVGLILFSGTAFVQCPLTADYQAFKVFLDQVTTESISSGTTSLGSAIAKAAEVFKRSAQRKNKLLLLVTDGEDFVSLPGDLKKVVEKENITVFAWGAGSTQGAPVPLYDMQGAMTGYAKNKDGSIATSVLNEELLQQLASLVGGLFQRVTPDDGDIACIATALGRYEREQLEERSVTQYHDRYPLFLAGAWAALILEWLL